MHELGGCCKVADASTSAGADGKAWEGGIDWLLINVFADFPALQARCKRQLDERAAVDAKRREERKKRLEARRAATTTTEWPQQQQPPRG